MYLETYCMETGLYKVIAYSIAHHILLERLVYASSFTEAENQFKEELIQWKN